MTKRALDYLKSERQWSRECRLVRARAMLAKTDDVREREFWREVLEALG